MIQDKVLTALEFDKVANKVKKYLLLSGSAEILLNERPADSFEQLKYKLDLTKEADTAITAYNTDPIYPYDDIESIIEKAVKLSVLSIGEILKITRLYKCSRQFKTKITSIQSESIIILKEFVAKIFTDKKFEDESDRCFISEEQVSDNASEQLLSIRKKTARLNEKIKEVLSSVLNKNTDYIQENYITLRSGRYVIPVKTDFKNKVKGMLHEQSSSGATVYIEPEQVVELNNELKLLEIKEKEEIEKILRAFTDKIRRPRQSFPQTIYCL